jgi:hypothetical protein
MNMKKTLSLKPLLLGVLALLSAGEAARAAAITWSGVSQITGTSNLLQTGTPVAALNLGGTAGAPLPIAGTDITFVDAGLTAVVGAGSVSNTGNGGFYSPVTNNANLDAVLDSHSYITGNNPNSRGRLDLTGLTLGQTYLVQVIGVTDDRVCCTSRTQTVDDGLGHISGNLQRGLANFVTGTFTADAATQSIFVSGVNDPGLSGLVLRAVPEPGVTGMLAAGAAVAMLRRARRR